MKIRPLMVFCAALLGVSAGLFDVLGEEAKLQTRFGEAGDRLGSSVSISGRRIAVSAYGADDVALDGGAVYIYERVTRGVWKSTATLLPSVANPSMQFGRSAVSLHRNHVAVGARFADPNTAGRVFVFRRRPSGEWLEVASLGPSVAGEQLGEAVALHGNRLVAGASFGGADRALVYERTPGGQWVNTAELTAPPGQDGASFGSEVAIDGRRIVIGAPLAAAAFVYELQPDGTWEFVRLLEPTDTSINLGFGTAVGISGSLIVVSNPGENVSKGAVYVFERLAAGWTTVETLSPTTLSPNDRFGGSVAIEGERIAVGASGSDVLAPGSGAAYVFDRLTKDTWRQTHELRASDGSVADAFGSAVDVSLDLALVGVPEDDGEGESTGSAYVFELDG